MDVVVDGVPCKALIDSGAGVTGISKDFYSRSAIPTRPSPLRPMACRSVTGEVMNTTQLLKDVSFTLGGFHSKESFLLLPISRAYEILIGMDFMIRNKMIVNCDPQAMCHLSLVSTRPAHDIASILPMWSEDCGVLDGVYDLCSLDPGNNTLPPKSPRLPVSDPFYDPHRSRARGHPLYHPRGVERARERHISCTV